jgi:protease-4
MTESETPTAKEHPTSPPPPGEWERDVLNRLAFAAISEQRRARRWNTVFKLGLLAYLVVLLVMWSPDDWLDFAPAARHVALVEVSGVIAPEGRANADLVASGLRAAFEDENTAGVILRINSPGGSPVQAGLIHDEIRRLRSKHPETPLYAVIADVCASGGYYVAAAADRIYADKASMVGSIGVLLNGFGFVEAMERVGVERRLLAAGRNKGLLDPFSPLREEEVAHIRGILDTVHAQFIEVVRRGRGDRLKEDPDLFSGLVWSGEQSVSLGLVDALGSTGYVAREVIGIEDIVDFTPQRSLFEGLARLLGTAVGEVLATRVGLDGLQLR